jgi:putative addiction module component (TIGR02574 family)
MERDATEVLHAALALSPEDRSALIDLLIGSLDQPVDEEAEESWRQEIQRRLEQIDRGEVQLIPWEEARRRLRSHVQG